MAIVSDAARPRRRLRTPSVREVCLVGVRGAAVTPGRGDRVVRSGRGYRVVATLGRIGPEGEADAARYVHLEPEPPRAEAG